MQEKEKNSGLDESDQPEQISRSQKKRDAEYAQDIGERLVSLSVQQLEQLNLPDNLFDSVLEAKQINAHGGKKRQLQFIGKLMRNTDVDLANIEAFFAKIDRAGREKTDAFKLIEHWRDELIINGNEAVSKLIESYPDTDVQLLRQLIRNANNKKNEKLAKKSKKSIFQYIKNLIEISEG